MPASSIFNFCNMAIFFGWLLLLVVPKWKYTRSLILNGLLVVFAILYTFLLFKGIGQMSIDSFNTLAKVKLLFQSDEAVVVGWVHYLVFDLFVGTYIVRESLKMGLSRWVYSCLLPFTFMSGPFGYLLFVVVKFIKTRSLYEPN